MTTTDARRATDRGISLVDLLLVVIVAGIVSAIAVPAYVDLTTRMRLASAAREVERELQGARLRAVTSNRPIRVRFDCPTAGQYRVVELLGTPGTPQDDDSATRRCSATSYPYPAPDTDPITVPNQDGPLKQLPQLVSFNASRTVEFWPDGSVHADASGTNPWPVLPTTGISIVLQQDSRLRTITVNGLGKIQLLP